MIWPDAGEQAGVGRAAGVLEEATGLEGLALGERHLPGGAQVRGPHQLVVVGGELVDPE